MKILATMMFILFIVLAALCILGLFGMIGYFTYLSIVGRGDEIPPAPGSPKSMYEEHWRKQDENRKTKLS